MAWPWHLVDSDGTVYRLGPDANPDGGILRLVLPDGTIHTQSPTGAPLTIVDAGFPYPLGRLPFDGGWITPAPIGVTGDPARFRYTSDGDLLDKADFDTSATQAWAGGDAAPGLGVDFGMYLQAFSVGSDAQAIIQEGLMAVYRAVVEAAADTAYDYPSGAELHPDDTATVLSLKLVGQISQTFGNASGSTSVRQIDPADYDVVDGPVWQTPTLISSADEVFAVATATDTDPQPFEFDVVFDEPNGAAMYVTSIDGFAPSGGSWGWDTPDWEFALLEGVGTAGNGTAPQWVATVQPARYRVVPTAGWLSTPNYYYADVGLWLGGDFTDLTGYPTALPTGASELDFVVLAPGDDPGDETFDPPYGDYYIYDDGGTPTNDSGQSGTTPTAGSHVWVLWFGPDGDTTTDPVPPVTAASLAPASLASDGTG